MRWRRNLRGDGVTGPDAASLDDDGHHTGTRFGQSVFIAAHDLAEQAGPERFDLTARVAQAGHGQQARADPKHGAGRERVKVKSGGRDVFAQVAGLDVVTAGAELVEQLDGEQMNLAKVRSGRVGSNPRPMTDRRPEMCVADDTHARNEFNFDLGSLRKVVRRVEMNGYDGHAHSASFAPRATKTIEITLFVRAGRHADGTAGRSGSPFAIGATAPMIASHI
jgi:hypothetical protein